MSFSIRGYVLEPPRVGTANSSFTMTPNDVISDPGTYAFYFPDGSEPNPRVDYMTLVMADGLLVDASFGWTKNEVISRFDFDGSIQRFRTLPGGPLLVVGRVSSVSPDSNTVRLKVPTPTLISSPSAPAPWRLSVGTGSGVTLITTLVSVFGVPPVGTVEILTSTGELNWNPGDLSTYNGESVRFQRQAFFGFNESNGKLGLSSDVLLLNPLPATGQYPLVRLGFGAWLIPDDFPDESTFGVDPPAGHFKWAADTGRLKFTTADVSLGKPVYFDGTLMQGPTILPRGGVGTVVVPTTFSTQLLGGDLIFTLSAPFNGVQFPYFSYVTAFDPVGQAGVVQLLVSGGTTSIQFSLADQTTYGATPVTLVFGDFPLERGISLRFFRTPVNLTGQSATKDVTSVYLASGATFANPIMGAPDVFLPQVPRDDGSLVVSVAQGTGTFTPGVLPILDGSIPLPVSPGPTYGYIIDYDNKRLKYAFRKNGVLVPFLEPTGAMVLPDPLVQPGGLMFELETGPGTGNFFPLTIGTDILFDDNATVTFVSATGALVTSGSGSFVGTTLTDPAAAFTSFPTSVFPGDTLIVAGRVYTVSSITDATTLVTDLPIATTPGSVVYEIHRGKETLADRYFAPVELLDPNTKIERILPLGIIANDSTIVSGTATFPNTTTLSDTGVDFLLSGVQPGDTILLTSGADAGSTRTVTTVTQYALTVQRLFVDFTPETYSITRRLHVPLQWVGLTRIRFGTQPTSPFTTSVNVVATDSAFTAPGSLSQGVVEVSAQTGNLNFSSVAVGTGAAVFWARTLRIKKDYKISAGLGFISFTDRFLAYEEALITYATVDPTTGLPVPVVEPAVFLVRKEVCQPHPTPTSTLSFNPTGRVVAGTPVPAVFRGGRPQEVGTQCLVSTTLSTITFLADSVITDALPHGAVVNPIENVYIDYYITQAMGGEQSISVQQPPMAISQVGITDDPSLDPASSLPRNTFFQVAGDQTANFSPGFLLRVEQIEVHLIASSTYAAGTGLTTVVLTAGDAFQDAYNDPQLYETSGPTRTTPVLFFPSYFQYEMAPYTTVPRGMNKVGLTGDRTAFYKQGTVIRFTDNPLTFQHFYLVSAVDLDSNGNTVLTLTSNTRQQYAPGNQILSYSSHPILEDGATSAATSKVPVLTEPMLVFRRVEGQVGRALTLKTDYTIDDSGSVTYRPPLAPSEEISILYTGHTIQPAGLQLRASYTALTVPTSANGLLNQQLLADYTLDSPDTFYFRVETMTNFLAEISQEYQQAVKSSVPSGGPVTSNSGGGALFTKGRPSLYFDEGHLANEDIVARKTLLWYNDTVNLLEDALQDMDGRVVGNHSGRFLFDGTTGTKHLPVTNQIDDLFQVSPAPFTITYPPFVVTSIGTFQAMYVAAPTSRFFSTALATYGVTSTGVNTGDPVYDTKHKNLTSVSDVHTRLAWAVVTEDAPVGALTLVVDNAVGAATLARPPFQTNMLCVVQRRDGSFINDTTSPVTVTVVDQKHLSVTGLLGAVPAGSTIYRSPKDTSAQTGVDVLTYYQVGRDYSFDPTQGMITYVKPFPPYDGSDLSVPVSLRAVPLPSWQPLVAFVGYINSDTAPAKFPALYGGTTDDSGDMSFPILSPSFNCEYTLVGEPLTTPIGLLANEDEFITQIQAVTTPPFIGTGSHTAVNTIQLGVGTFPSPVPKIHDLVRVLTGTNAGSAYRRVTSVTANSITVDPGTPWVIDSNFQFTVAVSTTTAPEPGLFTTTTLTDTFANFSGVSVGWTVVILSAPYAGRRLQVTQVNSPTVLTFSAGLPAGGTYTYRIDNPLATFGGPGSLLDQLNSDLFLLLLLYTFQAAPTAEQPALSGFFEQLFTDVVVGTNGQTSGTTFTDTTVDFVANGVLVGQVLYIRTGTVRGVYQVQAVTTNTLTVDVTFPFVVVGVSYRVDQFFGVSVQAMRDVFSALAAVDDFITSTQDFETLVATVFPVILPGPVSDTVAFANGLLTSDLTTRDTTTAARQTSLQTPGTGYTSILSNILGGSEQLYGKRYTWIDARINLKTGIIVKKQRAVDARVQAQADVVNQLFKLLAVQGG